MAKTSAQICILGGGFGGLYTALHLSRSLRFWTVKPQITLIEPKERFLFTPLLYEQLTGELQTWEIAPAYRKLLVHTGVIFCQEWVQAVDLQQRQVTLQSGQVLAYDYLVLAAGQQTRLDWVPGVAAHALTFRSLADSDRLYQKLQRQTPDLPAQIAIVGAGANGVELACKLADYCQTSAQIHLLDRGDTILSGFSAASQTAAYRALGKRQVQLTFNATIEAIESDQIRLTQQGQVLTFPVDILLWTTGTQSWEWVRSLRCPQTPQGQLRVRSTLQLLDHPEVFALGDLAAAQDPQGAVIGPSAQITFQQATVVARNLHAQLNRQRLQSFHYQHQGEMLTLGIGSAVVATSQFQLDGAAASLMRQWAYVMRLPTLRHRFRVVSHRLAQGLLRVFTRSQFNRTAASRPVQAQAGCAPTDLRSKPRHSPRQ